jgi:2-dehydro-3-deoxygalactonokinase
MRLIWQGPYIAVDWGTTNRRAWRIGAGGAVEDVIEDACGITAIPAGGFPAEIAFLRGRLGDLPMLLGGMVGSNRGWREAPYVPCPAGPAEIAAAIRWIDPRTGIAPGVSQDRRDAPDVMRGEEVQIIGALASGALAPDALVCLPGTHAKWVCLIEGRIAGFATFMTGEIFALLSEHSILAPQLQGAARPGPGFAAGVAASLECDPLSCLFRLRAAALLDAPIGDAPSYASGLLIGAEMRAGLGQLPGADPCFIGRPELCALYAAALAQVRAEHPGEPAIIDGGEAFRAGIAALIGEFA